MRKSLLAALCLLSTPVYADSYSGGGGGGGGSGVSSINYTCPTTIAPQTGAVTIPNGIGEITLTSNLTVTNAQCGVAFDSVSGFTVTLPVIGVSAGNVENPFFITVKNADTTSSMTVSGNGTNINYNGTSGASITLAAGQSVGLWINAANSLWQASGTVTGGGAHVINPIIVTFAMSPYTYTPSGGLVEADVYCIGGGGGGGSGAYQASGSAESGGSGGGSASSAYARFSPTDLGASVTVTIGAGGTAGAIPSGGVSGAWTAAAGGNGGNGGATTFGTLMTAYGGGFGAGGALAATSTGGGTGGLGASAIGSTGGLQAGVNGAVGANGSVSTVFAIGGPGAGGANGAAGTVGGAGFAGGGGGAGGGVSTTPAAFAGGSSMTLTGEKYMNLFPATSGGAIGAAGNAGGSSFSHLVPWGYIGGTGGTGGGSSITSGTAGGAGGVGAIGSGGGGGGSTLTTNTATTGAGGAGGNGQCAIVELF